MLKYVPMPILLLVGLAGALALVAAVFVIPLTLLKPDLTPVSSPGRALPVSGGGGSTEWTAEANDWASLADKFAALHTPAQDGEPEQDAGAIPEPPAQEPDPDGDLFWQRFDFRYVGFVSEPTVEGGTRLVAWLVINDRQHVVVEGQAIGNIGDDEKEVTVRAVTPKYIELERGSRTRRFDIAKPKESLTPEA